MNELTWVRAAASGDEGAERWLYRHHAPALRCTLLRWTESADVDDLAQEVWLRAFAALPRFRGDCAFATWLYQIARNVAISRGRKRREVAVDPATLAERSLARPADAALRIDLERALAALPDRMRLVLWLHDVEGWTHVGIANRLGIAPGTSKSQLFKARAKLRSLLKPAGAGARHAA